MKIKILLPIFILLLVFTYYFEERGKQVKTAAQKAENALGPDVRMQELVEIKLPEVRILKKGESFWDADNEIPLDPKSMETFFKVLGGLNAKRKITPEELKEKNELYFIPLRSAQVEFVFNKSTIVYTLGPKVAYSENFYLQREVYDEKRVLKEKNLYLAEDVGEAAYTYEKGSEHNSSFRHDRLLSWFTSTKEQLWDKRLFNITPVSECTISSLRNKSFKVLLGKTKATVPAVVPGLAYHQDLFERFSQELPELRSRSAILTGPGLKHLRSTVNCNDQIECQLYGEYKGKPGHFVDCRGKIIFDMSEQQIAVFFLSAQNFWDKHPLPVNSSFGKNPETLQLGFEKSAREKETVEIRLPLTQDFQVEVSGPYTAQKQALKNLLSLILAEAKSVDYDDTLPGKSKNGVVYPRVELKLAGLNLSFYREGDGDYILSDEARKLKFRYDPINDALLGAELKDYFMRKP